jgi:Na+/glutamate symporter
VRALFLLALLLPAGVAAAPVLADAATAFGPAALPSVVGGVIGGIVGSWRVNGRHLTRAARRAARAVLVQHEARLHASSRR